MRIDLFDRQRHGTVYMTRIQGATFDSTYIDNLKFTFQCIYLSNARVDVYQRHIPVGASVNF